MKKILFVLFALVLSIPSFAQLHTGYCRALKAQRINNKIWGQGMITDVYVGSTRVGTGQGSFIGDGATRVENNSNQVLRIFATGQVTDKNGTANFKFKTREALPPGKVETYSFWLKNPLFAIFDRKIDHNSMNRAKINSITTGGPRPGSIG